MVMPHTRKTMAITVATKVLTGNCFLSPSARAAMFAIMFSENKISVVIMYIVVAKFMPLPF